MEEYSEPATAKVSKYHSAFDQLRRLGYLWQTISINVRNGDYLNWNINLDRIWMELIGDLEEKSDEEKEMEKINKKILALHPLYQSTARTFNKVKPEHTKKLSEQYLTLTEKEIYLRRLQNKQGKGTAFRDEGEDDFE